MTNPSIELVWSIVLFIILLGASSLLCIISYRGFKQRNMYSGFSTIASALLLAFFAFYEILHGLFPWPYGPYFFIISAILVSIQIVFWLVRKRIVDKNPDKIEIKDTNIKGKFSLKQEIIRKSFHLAGILVPVGFFWVFPLISNLILKIITTPGGQAFYEYLWGDISNYPYIIDDPTVSGELIFFTLWCCLMFMLAFDFIRIFASPEYSIFLRLLKYMLREKEYLSAGPQVLIVLGAVASFFFAKIGWCSYEIAVSATFTACIADGIVAVVGKRFGKYKVRSSNGSDKSIEGFVIGFICAYLCSMVILGPIYAIFAAVIFVLLDIFTAPIADNLLNPIFLTVGVWGFTFLFNIPIGWGF